MHPLLQSSDKAFWHGYVQFYEQHWQGRSFTQILEIGVLRGNSIRWLAERFPQANITGADILPQQSSWPVDARISYAQLDQGDTAALHTLMRSKPFDLIIEDGSHFPQHQARSLVEGMAALQSGGMYILEDIHTSHPSHELYQKNVSAGTNTALSLLFALEHLRRIGKTLDNATTEQLATNSLFSANEITTLNASIGALHFYRRNHLPDQCWHCGGNHYNYAALRCICGAPVYSEADSMSWVLTKA